MSYYYMLREFVSLRTYNIDIDLDVKIRLGMGMAEGYSIPNEGEFMNYEIEWKRKQTNLKSNIVQKDVLDKTIVRKKDQRNKINVNDVTMSNTNSSIEYLWDTEEKEKYIGQLVVATSHLSSMIQLDHPGFLPNLRQHRQFGLAVLQMSQSLLEHIALIVEGNQDGLFVSDASSSSPEGYYGIRHIRQNNESRGAVKNDTKTNLNSNDTKHEEVECSVAEEGVEYGNNKNINEYNISNYHIFGWRDFFDIAVRWRRLSESMDVVHWLDRYFTTYKGSETIGKILILT